MPRLPFSSEPDESRDNRSPRAQGDEVAGAGGGGSGKDSSVGGDSGGGVERGALTVSQVSALVRQAVVQGVQSPVRILGEISNFTNRSHCFFSLKDEGATLRCVCFASNARKLGFVPADGMSVVATGRIDYYDAQGQLQLYVDRLEPVGQGVLEMQLRALCQELRELGYFDAERKQPLPIMPRTVAVVTSRSAAALQDVINTAQRRCPGCRLLLYDVRVQGAAASQEIAAALNTLSRFGPRMGIDAIILTRGGGSIEDLWAFNERVVADAVYRCTLPVVAAIGHETDTTVAELVADARCSTPTQAAMLLIPDRAAIAHQLSQLSHRLVLLAERYVQHQGQRVLHAASHPAMQRPDRMLQPVRQRLTHLNDRMARAMPAILARHRQRTEALARQLQAVSPRHVLERGYSYTLGPDKHVLRDPAAAPPGTRITTVLAAGQLTSTVTGDAATDARGPDESRAEARGKVSGPKKRRDRRSAEDEPGLFES